MKNFVLCLVVIFMASGCSTLNPERTAFVPDYYIHVSRWCDNGDGVPAYNELVKDVVDVDGCLVYIWVENSSGPVWYIVSRDGVNFVDEVSKYGNLVTGRDPPLFGEYVVTAVLKDGTEVAMEFSVK